MVREQHSHNPDTAPQNRTKILIPLGIPPLFAASAIVQTENSIQSRNKINSHSTRLQFS